MSATGEYALTSNLTFLNTTSTQSSEPTGWEGGAEKEKREKKEQEQEEERGKEKEKEIRLREILEENLDKREKAEEEEEVRGDGRGNVPHGELRHTVTRNNHIKMYSENRFMLPTGGPATGCFVSPCVSTHRGVR